MTDAKKHLYLIGSLRNPYIPELEKRIIKDCSGVAPFADWFSAGPEADDKFQAYFKGKGISYREALKSYAGRHIFEFDKYHLDRCDGAILVMPAGKSCHLEAGYVAKTKPVYMLYPDGEPQDRYEIMAQFMTEIFYSENELIEYLNVNYGSESVSISDSSIRPGVPYVPIPKRFSKGDVSGRIDVC